MYGKYWKIFLVTFTVLCWASTISIMLYWIYLFSLNEDLTVLDYKTYYYDESSAYPILSLCFKNPFNKTKLEQRSKRIDAESYLEFLEGNNYSSEMWGHDFKEIPFDISEHIVSYWIEWRNGSSKLFSPASHNVTLFSPTLSGFWRQGFYHCYGMLTSNDVQMQKFSVLIKNEIFPSKIRPEKYDF